MSAIEFGFVHYRVPILKLWTQRAALCFAPVSDSGIERFKARGLDAKDVTASALRHRGSISALSRSVFGGKICLADVITIATVALQSILFADTEVYEFVNGTLRNQKQDFACSALG